MTLNGEMALILRYYTEFGNFRGALRKSDWQTLASPAMGHWGTCSPLDLQQFIFSVYIDV